MNLSDLARNSRMPSGHLAKRGYMRWWHSFWGANVRTGETRAFFVEFFVINPALGGEHPVLGQHPYFKRRGMKPSYVMVKAGVFPDGNGMGGRQLHAFYPIPALQAAKCPLVLRTGAASSADTQEGVCLCGEDRLTGYVEVTPREAAHRSFLTDAGYMEWDLELSKSISCHTGILGGRLGQALRLWDNCWHGEGIRSFFRGTVILDDQIYEVTPGVGFAYADKHWGSCFSRPWFQFACGKLYSSRTDGELRHSALAVSSFRPRAMGLPLRRRFLLQLTYMGEDFDFTHCRWDVKEARGRFVWHILARSTAAVLKLSGSCKKENMISLKYEDPDGQVQPLRAAADGIGSLQLYRRMPEGRELIDTLRLEDALCIYRAIQ